MGKNTEMKDLRKQLRNVVQEMLPAALSQEVALSIKKALSAEQEAQLAKIEGYCRENLEKQDKRAMNILGFIMQEVKVGISNELSDMRIELIAVRELLFEKAGITENVDEQLAERKAQVNERLKAEAVARQQAIVNPEAAPTLATEEHQSAQEQIVPESTV